jgi:hypothetical protein
MLPPITDQEVETKNFVSHKSPLSDWIHVASFDTAKRCQGVLDQMREDARNASEKSGDQKTRTMIIFGRCIPSDSIQFK